MKLTAVVWREDASDRRQQIPAGTLAPCSWLTGSEASDRW